MNSFLFEAISRYPLQVVISQAIFPKSRKELPLVALFGQEKLAFLFPGFPLLSRLGVYGFLENAAVPLPQNICGKNHFNYF
ncbi:hypothetical protein [Flavobacterium sp.]|uniref:hypothetical protein n=1 Tax=Flavobacterium sp. TaxID=239 RepID=UPI0037BE846A